MKYFLIVALTVMFLPTAAMAADDTDVKEVELPESARCLPWDTMTDYLKRAWKESPVPEGDVRNGDGMTLFLSERGTWTMIERSADGHACVKSSGINHAR